MCVYHQSVQWIEMNGGADKVEEGFLPYPRHRLFVCLL